MDDNPTQGEIIAIITNPASTVETISIGTYTSSEPYSYPGDRNAYNCALAMFGYLGLRVDIASEWQRAAFSDVAVVGPTALQRNADQRWIGCVIQAIDTTNTGTGDGAVQYSGSLKNAAVTGDNADLIGDCQTSDQGPARCSQSHPREVLYFGGTRTTVHRKDKEKQCLALVTATLGKAPGSNTNPATTLYFAAANADGQPVTTNLLPAHTYLTCGVQAAATALVHSIIDTAHH